MHPHSNLKCYGAQANENRTWRNHKNPTCGIEASSAWPCGSKNGEAVGSFPAEETRGSHLHAIRKKGGDQRFIAATPGDGTAKRHTRDLGAHRGSPPMQDFGYFWAIGLRWPNSFTAC